jgi:two-component system response regulator QseB
MIVSAEGASSDQVEGLDAGADDYMIKPLNIDEFLARVRALLRRPLQDLDLIPLQTAAIDVSSRTVRMADGRDVRLSPREFRLFHLMATHPQRVHTRKHLRVSVFDGADAPSIVDTYVYYLRNKLGPQSVETVRGLGYRIGTI